MKIFDYTTDYTPQRQHCQHFNRNCSNFYKNRHNKPTNEREFFKNPFHWPFSALKTGRGFIFPRQVYHIMRIMWLFFCPHFVLTSHQAKAVGATAVNLTALHCVNARGVDAGMTQHVGKSHDVLVDGVKRAREKVAQIMRKHLAFLLFQIRLKRPNLLLCNDRFKPCFWLHYSIKDCLCRSPVCKGGP